MPIHYGSKDLNIFTISSPLATQLLHAVGCAYVKKIEADDSVAAVYFGDGAASEGDFHAAMNFAATLESPTLFLCRNNGWAISTPVNEQYKGDGIAARAAGYGIDSIRVDGGDARAVYMATAWARKTAISQSAPVLVEMMTHRMCSHSTSDDSSTYIPKELRDEYVFLDPLKRLQTYLIKNAQLTAEEDKYLRDQAIQEARISLRIGETEPNVPLESMFDDVFDVQDDNLSAQCQEAQALFDWKMVVDSE